MSNSLSDQLLKAGLVTEDQVKKAQEKPKRKPQQARKKAAKGKKRPAAKAKKPQQPEPQLSAEERAAIKAHKQKIREFLREHRLNKPKVAEEVKKALGKEEKPAAEENGEQPAKETAPQGPVADIKYHFQLNNRTHHLYVTAEQRDGLIGRELSILLRNDRYYLLTAGDLLTIREMEPNSMFFTAKHEDESSDENDPYAEYKVPDDLHW